MQKVSLRRFAEFQAAAAGGTRSAVIAGVILSARLNPPARSRNINRIEPPVQERLQERSRGDRVELFFLPPLREFLTRALARDELLLRLETAEPLVHEQDRQARLAGQLAA